MSEESGERGLSWSLEQAIIYTQQINIRGGKTRSPLVYEVKPTKTNPNKLTKREKTTFWQNLYPKLRKQIEVQVLKCEKKIFYTLNLTKANAR